MRPFFFCCPSQILFPFGNKNVALFDDFFSGIRKIPGTKNARRAFSFAHTLFWEVENRGKVFFSQTQLRSSQCALSDSFCFAIKFRSALVRKSTTSFKFSQKSRQTRQRFKKATRSQKVSQDGKIFLSLHLPRSFNLFLVSQQWGVPELLNGSTVAVAKDSKQPSTRRALALSLQGSQTRPAFYQILFCSQRV